jgi:8-oxo-dGTP pyrophosphatase MutT (NUDIX family)
MSDNSLPPDNSAGLPLSEDWLRGRFARMRGVPLPATGDGHLFNGAAFRPAAVLVPIVSRETGLTVLFTRRTEHLHNHAGQISFPGGRAERADESPEATALRETEEEIGLASSRVEILGHLNQYASVSGYTVTPVVGLVRPPLALRPDEFEVAEVFEVPLAFLLDPSNHRKDSMIRDGRRRDFYVVSYRHYYIWGLTAGVLVNFHSFLTSE